MLQNIRSLLLGLWILALGIFLVQNWGSAAVVVVAGQAGPAVPLSLVLLMAYGVGVGLGFLYVGSWQLHERALQRQAIRKLNQLLDRVRFLEAQLLPPTTICHQICRILRQAAIPIPISRRNAFASLPPNPANLRTRQQQPPAGGLSGGLTLLKRRKNGIPKLVEIVSSPRP
jgi:uncharacterized integral membrane protein